MILRTGTQKAAALMLALNDDIAAALFARMHEDEIRDLSGAMATLGNVSSDEVEALCAEFVATIV